MGDKLKVMLATEGTYPFHQGGVSTWCDILVRQLKQVDYVVYSLMMNPFISQIYQLPDNAQMIKLPLWGTEEPSEYLDIPFSKVYIAKSKTTDSVIESRFLPLFKKLIEEFISIKKKPEELGEVLFDLYLYFQEYEYKKSFKSEIVWMEYKRIVNEHVSNPENQLDEPSVYALIQSLGWVYRFMVTLNRKIPKVDVVHSAAAAFCGIPCVISKIENKTPYLLTEHGVYIREQYLSLSRRGYPSFLNSFFIRMINSITSLNYKYADVIAPVCKYNTRWELNFGVEKEKLNVIYNGVDNETFVPSVLNEKSDCPTAVSIARIDPLKDIINLIEATEIVLWEIPDVRVIVYGSISVESYYEECVDKIKELQLENHVILAGHTNDVPAAYNSGDIVVSSSISEAFPYSVVEAMMNGKPVVSTDVGGISEALGDCGILVTPRMPEELAKGMIKLFKNPDLIRDMGERARERALERFSIGNVLDNHYNTYKSMVTGSYKKTTADTLLQKQEFYAEKAYVLLNIGYISEAIEQFREAINAAPGSPAVPVFILEIADAYKKIGKVDKAKVEYEKIGLL